MIRRDALTTLAAAGGLLTTPSTSLHALPAAAPPAFVPCLNMSTIRGHKLGFVGELETAAKAGFRSVEIWIDSFQDYLKTNSTAETRRRISDLGLRVENAIGFAPWIVDEPTARNKGVDQLKREMAQLAEIGCKRIATPPIGAHTPDAPTMSLLLIAERYRAILDMGVQLGVVPQLELWGFARNLNRLSDVMYVAIESGHPAARVLLDIYHLYKGGSGISMLPFVGKPAIEIFHVNDYPASMPRETIVDADRIFPGDGVAPIKEALTAIKSSGRTIVLSLEVFNKSYYAQDAQSVAKTAFAKMNRLIASV
ncbi:sugar phosphate isomerase/epimerase [Spirosoma oryzae]|uniref:Sugar phosphate isomerase/epimerase n=1 Tax=Spirosoma oryzae TaxID=1469603 RepID=A0A2T0ST09_9BACT|nr:sugar phosphate isomerase/epimerase family protein [Spirosoma oryzae]PRY36550.1 sugar phosphate isomerase/epimerase [Spirosoma oryzae]